MKERSSFNGKAKNNFRSASISAFASLMLGVCAHSNAQTIGVFIDQGGTVFNVKAYGATGNGTTDDSAAIQSAINAAASAGGGVVYVPAGTYLLSATVENNRSDIVTLSGSGMGSQLKVNTAVGLSYPSSVTLGQFHRGRIEHLRLLCTNASTQTAVRMTDLVTAPALHDLTISLCDTAFDLVNQNWWTERLVATQITDDRNNHLFHYDPMAGDENNSYGYGIYEGIYVDKGPNQDVFYLTGGA